MKSECSVSISDLKGKNASKAFEEIFHFYYPLLCRAVYKIIKDKAKSEDLVQETFIRFWEKKDEIEINTHIKPYLYKAALNNSFNFIKREQKIAASTLEEFLELETSEVNPEIALEIHELQQRIDYCVTLLTPGCSTIFSMSREEKLSYREISELLAISIKTVENQMSKALKWLHECINVKKI